MNFVEKVFGTHSDRELKYIYPIVDKIEKMRPTMQAMSASHRGRLWMIFCRRHSQPSGRQPREF